MILLCTPIVRTFFVACLCWLFSSAIAVNQADAHSPLGVGVPLTSAMRSAVPLSQSGLLQANTNVSTEEAAAISTSVPANAPTYGEITGRAAGTLRVNNLANLEALLNIAVNSGEIVGLIWGIYLTITAFTSTGSKSSGSAVNGAGSISGAAKLNEYETGFSAQSDPVASSRAANRFYLGIFLIICALALPGCVNWLLASARDASLCG
jgi:hypothetical protein